MLPLNVQNRLDLIFCQIIRKEPNFAASPTLLAEEIFDRLGGEFGSIEFIDVKFRVAYLVTNNTPFGVPGSYWESKKGRPRRWFSETTHIRVPTEYAKALVEIALEWQDTQMQSKIPF